MTSESLHLLKLICESFNFHMAFHVVVRLLHFSVVYVHFVQIQNDNHQYSVFVAADTAVQFFLEFRTGFCLFSLVLGFE